MKRFVLVSAALLFVMGTCANASTLFDVWYDTDFDGVKDLRVGIVSAFVGFENSVQNYGYVSASAHPIHGPTPEAYKSKMYLYEGSDGLSFGFFHNVDDGGNAYWNHVRWKFQFRNMTSAIALIDDSAPDNRGEIGIVKNDAFNYDAGWAYALNTDGGVFNRLWPTNKYWEILIDPIMFGDIQEWGMYSGAGSYFSLWKNPMPVPAAPGGDYYGSSDLSAFNVIITPHVVPEPSTLLLLGVGLLGFRLVLRQRRK